MRRWMGKIPYAALTLSLLLACQTTTPPVSSGALSFRFQTPAANPGVFQLKAIPQGTEKIELLITGDGLQNPITRSFALGAAGSSHQETIPNLPVGNKQVRVQALNGQELLAQGTASVSIQANQTAQTEIELLPIVKLALAQPLPLDLAVKSLSQGQGLAQSQEAQAQVKAGEQSATLDFLPLGQKQITLELTLSVAQRSFKVTLPVSELEVKTSGNQISLSLEQVLNALSGQLSDLMDQFAKDPAAPLGLGLWAAGMNQNHPGLLMQVFLKLPAAIQARLRQNPEIAKYLPLENAQPNPPASAAPTSEPTAEPTPEASAVSSEALIADARLAITRPERPVMVMLQPPQNVAGELRVLRPDDTIQLAANQVWGLLVRSSYSGTEEVPYGITLKAEGSTSPGGRVWNGTLRQRFSLNQRNFSGEAVAFGGNAGIALEPGKYTLQLTLKHPETAASEIASYQLQVN